MGILRVAALFVVLQAAVLATNDAFSDAGDDFAMIVIQRERRFASVGSRLGNCVHLEHDSNEVWRARFPNDSLEVGLFSPRIMFTFKARSQNGVRAYSFFL
jgi:hypothetical protein